MKGSISDYEYELSEDWFTIGEFIIDINLTTNEAIELANTILSYYGENK